MPTTQFDFGMEDSLLALADGMAAASAAFNTIQGYDQFIQAREQFKTALHAAVVSKVHRFSRATDAPETWDSGTAPITKIKQNHEY